jgi:hypothetical protein
LTTSIALKGKVSGTGKTAATATTPEQTGASVQGAARAKLDFAKATTKRLYDAADASAEGAMPVSGGTVGGVAQRPGQRAQCVVPKKRT